MKEHSIKAIKEEFKNKGVFYTPPELSEYLKSLVDKEIKNVYILVEKREVLENERIQEKGEN